MIGYRDLYWREDTLYRTGSKAILARIIPDERYPGMWRAQMPSGATSDLANKARAKDAAMEAALAGLNYRKTPSAARTAVLPARAGVGL
jgi:hypothetical protein